MAGNGELPTSSGFTTTCICPYTFAVLSPAAPSTLPFGMAMVFTGELRAGAAEIEATNVGVEKLLLSVADSTPAASTIVTVLVAPSPAQSVRGVGAEVSF